MAVPATSTPRILRLVDPPGKRASYTQGLRDVADWLDANPHVPLPHLDAELAGGVPTLSIYVDPEQTQARLQIAAVVRAMGRAHETRLHHGFVAWRRFAGLAVAVRAVRRGPPTLTLADAG